MIIDFRVTVPADERQTDRAAGGASYMSNYSRIYKRERGGGQSAAALVERMTAAGVDRAVLQAEWGSGDYRVLNDAVARIVAQFPDRFIGYCTVNPTAGDDMATVVER